MKKSFKYILVLHLFLLLPSLNFSQLRVIDSLLVSLKTGKVDSNTVNILNALSFEYFSEGESEKALQYSSNALSLAQKINFTKGEAEAYFNSGKANAFFEDFSPAIEDFLNSLSLKKEMHDLKGIAEVQNNIGLVCLNQGNYSMALSYFSAVLKSKVNENNSGSVYSNIGHAYYGQNNLKEALKNYLTAIQCYKKINSEEAMAKCYGYIGNIYLDQKLYQDALNNYLVALDIEQEKDNKKGTALYYSNAGKAYFFLNKQENTIENYEAAIKIQEEIGDLKGMALSNAQLGNLLTLKKKKNGGRVYLKEALRLSRQYGDFKTLSLTYLYISRNDSVRKEKEDAKKNYELYLAYSDSIKVNWKLRKEKLENFKLDFEKILVADSLRVREKNKTKEIIGPKAIQPKRIYIYAISALLIIIFTIIGIVLLRGRKNK